MKFKKFLTVGLVLILWLIALAVGSRWVFETKTKAQQPSYPEGSIRWYVQQVKTQGEDHVAVVTQPSYRAPADINDAVSNSSLFLGQLTSTSTSWDDNTGSVTTWYKFTVSENLVQRAFVACSYCTAPTIPSDLQPVSSGQLVIAFPGGSALIDGVVVEEQIPGFSGLVQGQRYLLFVNFDPNTNIGTLNYGPSGALLVTTDNNFAPTIELPEGQADQISSGLAAQYSNSLTSLRSALNPSTCNPAQQQDCEDNGGTWNSTNCTCQMPPDPCVHKPWLCP